MRHRLRTSVIFFVVMAATACTPMQSRIDPPYPYQGQDHDLAEIQAIAAENCGISPEITGSADIHPFTTDGCSMWPDSDWRECCIEHDIKYWCADSDSGRKMADQVLRECVRDHSGATNAFLMYIGTRLGGFSLFPFPWRWGYGYPWLGKPKQP